MKKTTKSPIRKTTVMLPDADLYQLKIAAAEARTSLSGLLRALIADYLKTRTKGSPR